MTALDPRLTPARPDLAAASLRGRVEATRYVEGVSRRVVASSAPLRRRPASDAPLDTEALFGEEVVVFDEAEGWSWGQLARDGYVGYLPSVDLGEAPAPTHRIAAVRTHAYPGPSNKLPPWRALSLGAMVSVVRLAGDFSVGADGAHYFSRHIEALGTSEPDFVAVAERFVGVPYLWGGRTSEGIDCSGLTQTALRAAGIGAPRDSDMLENLGAPVLAGEALRRGDLVFWKGHVGIMQDAARLLHANGWHMKVVSETLAEARTRIAAQAGGDVTSIRRL